MGYLQKEEDGTQNSHPTNETVTFTEVPISPVKQQALRRYRLQRNIWLTMEIFFLAALLALLVVHSFRLSVDTGDNSYTQWTSSWVMILLSVLLVVVSITVFVTYYYFRTLLAWVRSPNTTDEHLLNPQTRASGHKITWRDMFKSNNGSSSHRASRRRWQRWQQRPESVALEAVDDGRGFGRGYRSYSQRPCQTRTAWMSPGGRNSRAWRQQMREDNNSFQLGCEPSRFPSTSGTDSSYSRRYRKYKHRRSRMSPR